MLGVVSTTDITENTNGSELRQASNSSTHTSRGNADPDCSPFFALDFFAPPAFCIAGFDAGWAVDDTGSGATDAMLRRGALVIVYRRVGRPAMRRDEEKERRKEGQKASKQASPSVPPTPPTLSSTAQQSRERHADKETERDGLRRQ